MDYNKMVEEINRGELSNVYLLFGQEQYLCEKMIQILKKRILNDSFGDLNYEYMEGTNINIQQMENACETLPFMSEKRLVLVKNFPYFMDGNKEAKEKDAEILSFIEYLKKIPSSTCLVFWQTQGVDKRKKLFQTIKKDFEVISFERLKEIQLEKWLIKNIKQKGKTAPRSVIHYFIENSDYLSKNSTKTLGDIENEMNKIIDYIGERREIIQEDIEKNLPRKLENDIFKMIDAIGKKEREVALKLLMDMLREGEKEIRILGTISWHFRNLIQCKELKNKGYSPNEIASKLKLAPFIVKKAINQGQYFDEKALQEALYYMGDTDVKIKTGKINQRLALEMLIYQYTM